jgi:hypothetical protein
MPSPEAPHVYIVSHTSTQPYPKPLTLLWTLPHHSSDPGAGQCDMVLIFVDKSTKRSHFIPIKQTDTAEDTARCVFDVVIRLRDPPSVIVSYRDASFTFRFWRGLFDPFGTKLAISSAYHPQTDGCQRRWSEWSRRWIAQRLIIFSMTRTITSRR